MPRSRLFTFVSASVALFVLLGGSASAQIGPTIADACASSFGAAPGADRGCRGPEHLSILAGYECRTLGGGDACDEADGRTYDPDVAKASGDSWIGKSLGYQHRLDDNVPLQEELWPHTHNSFNADAYGDQTLYGTDPNQTYKIEDQLNMGIRAVEIDLHWAPSINAKSGQSKAVLVCHGNQDIPPVHLGCLPTDPTIDDRLPELATWLQAHPSEVVMLYLENQLQQTKADDPSSLEDSHEAHNEAAAAIESNLGDYIFRPATRACESAPLGTLSRADILAAGKQLIVVGNCESGGPSDWNSWVFLRDPLWQESGLDYGNDYTADRCAAERPPRDATHPNGLDYTHNWIRYYADQTGLSDGAQGGGDNTVEDVTNEVRCGVNMIGFDLLEPFDARLAALVWSWRTNEPHQFFDGACAVHGADARFSSEDCRVQTQIVVVRQGHRRKRKKVVETYVSHPYACFDGVDWHITSASNRFSSGQAECAAEGLGSFGVPRNGWQNEQLRLAKGSTPDVWVNSAFLGGAWGLGN